MSTALRFWTGAAGPLFCAFLMFCLGTRTTFNKWAIPEKMQILFRVQIIVCTILLIFVRVSCWSAFLISVCISPFLFFTEWHRLHLLDGMTLWLCAALSPLYFISTSHGFFLSLSACAAALCQIAGFLWLYKIGYGKLNSFFGESSACVLLFSGLCHLIWKPDQWIGWAVMAAGAVLMLFAWIFREKKKPLLLFDLDGTLINSQPMVFETFRRVFKEKMPEKKLTSQELYSFFGPTLETTFLRYFPEEEVPGIIDLYQQINLELHKTMLEEMPHAKETLKALKEKGYSIGIVSNKRRNPVLFGLEMSGLKPYVDYVAAKEDQPECKPKPGGLLKACQDMKGKADWMLYVGDNAADIEAARNMAAYSVGYTIDDLQKQNLQQAGCLLLLDELPDLADALSEEKLWTDKSIW